MGKIPHELRATIAKNIRACRIEKYPGRGGSMKCAEAFGVSPQQWSPWERGMRTPDESRLQQIADFFDKDVEYMRRDHTPKTTDAINTTSPDLDDSPTTSPEQPSECSHTAQSTMPFFGHPVKFRIASTTTPPEISRERILGLLDLLYAIPGAKLVATVEVPGGVAACVEYVVARPD